MWVERYTQPGEFELVGYAHLGLRKKLPIGSLISHTKTQEVMIVENHEINFDKNKMPEIKISGRSYETIFENRTLRHLWPDLYPQVTAVQDILLSSNLPEIQIQSFLNLHTTDDPFLIDPFRDEDSLYWYITVDTDVTGSVAAPARSLKEGELYSTLLELLEASDLGIKNVRSFNNAQPSMSMIIYDGNDLSSQISFSHDLGEISNAEYLWSNKYYRNAAFVKGRWVEVLVPTTAVRYYRRWLFVDGSSIDSEYDVAPAGTDLDDVIALMEQRGRDALGNQKNVALLSAEIDPNARYTNYRQDFNMGDLVTVKGAYNETSVMRVVEYVEIEDKTGSKNYPVLSILDEEEV